jgi:hypothetical protein
LGRFGSFPGGVLDSTGRTAFVAVEDGVEAVDLETGLSRWKSREATWPVLAAGDQLIALSVSRGSLLVVGLDLTGRGDRVFRSDPVEIPAWADASSLRCNWTLEKRTLCLSWQARGHSGRSAGGTSSIDLVHARVTKMKDNPNISGAIPRMLEKLPVRWHRWIAGSVHAVVEEEAGPMSLLQSAFRGLVLHVWSETTRLQEARAQELIEGVRPMLLPGLEGLHVWVRDAGTFENATDGTGSAWQVHSALDEASGRQSAVRAGDGAGDRASIAGLWAGNWSARVLVEGKAVAVARTLCR